MRIYIITLLFITAFTAQTLGADEDQKRAFQQAYAAYQQAITGNSRHKAIEPARLAYETGKKLFGTNHKNTGNLALNYGRLLKDEAAAKVLTEALEIFEALYGEDGVELIDPLLELAEAETSYGRLSPARKYYSRALEITEKHDSKDGYLAGVINLEIGRIALSEAQSVSAMKYFKKAEKILQTIPEEGARAQLAQTHFWMGKYELAKNDYRDATEYLLSSLKVFEELAPNASVTMTNHAFLISAYEKRNMRDEATKHCIAIGKAKPVDPNQDYKPVYWVRPVYPLEAQRAGKEGFAIVSTTIDEEGFIQNPEVVEFGGHVAFKRAALEAIAKFRYVPRFENGLAVKTHDVKYKFSFGLSG